jgi:hypothetical protein
MNDPSYTYRRYVESCIAQGLDLEPSQATLDFVGALLALAPKPTLLPALNTNDESNITRP